MDYGPRTAHSQAFSSLRTKSMPNPGPVWLNRLCICLWWSRTQSLSLISFCFVMWQSYGLSLAHDLRLHTKILVKQITQTRFLYSSRVCAHPTPNLHTATISLRRCCKLTAQVATVYFVPIQWLTKSLLCAFCSVVLPNTWLPKWWRHSTRKPPSMINAVTCGAWVSSCTSC